MSSKHLKKTFVKKNSVVVPPSDEKMFDVFVAIRHTRSGDKRLGVYDSRDLAMEVADEAATRAAQDYGSGSASVFAAVLTLKGDALQP